MRQRTNARKERLASAIQRKDIAWIQKEHERLELEANGTSNDYYSIIWAWIKCGELKRATMAFEKMESLGVPSTAQILTALIKAHTRAGNLAIAGTIVQTMQDRNIQPSSIIGLNALLEYYITMTPVSPTHPDPVPFSTVSAVTANTLSKETNSSHDLVDGIWNNIEANFLLATSKGLDDSTALSYSIALAYRRYLLYLIDRIQDLDRAAELIDRMTASNISPELERSPVAAKTVIRCLMQHGYFTEIQKLIGQKEAALAKALPSAAWGHLMEACLSRGEDQKARWIYNDMIRYGIQPNSNCREMFSELQLKGGTTDRIGPEIAGAGTTPEEAEATTAARKQEVDSILSALFNRHPKPSMTS